MSFARATALAALLTSAACGDDAATGGAGGAGAGGGAGATTTTGGNDSCTPAEVVGCYDGPTETAFVGVCQDGERTCGPDGTFGACEGQVLPAVTDDCTLPGDEDCDGVSCSELSWAVSYDTEGSSTAHSAAFAPDGSLVVAGTFEGNLFFDIDGYLGGNNPYIFLVHVLPNGTSGWSDIDLAGSEASPVALAVGADGAMTYAGGFRGNMNLGGGFVSQGEDDVFVARRDAAGADLWAISAGDAASQRVTAVAVDANGDVLIAGRFSGTLDFGGGAALTSGSANLDVFVAKLSGVDGQGEWAVSLGDATLDDPAPSLALGPAGEVVIAGAFQGSFSLAGQTLSAPGDLDLYVAKLDGQGTPVWATSFGGTGVQRISGVGVDPTGDVLLGGHMFGTLELGGTLQVPDASSDAFVGKLDGTDGAALLGARFDDTGNTTVAALRVDSLGHVALTGTLESADFGGGVLARPQGDPAPFLVKLDGALAHLWSKVFAVSGTFTPTALAIDPATRTVGFAGGLAGALELDTVTIDSDAEATLEVGAAAFQP